MAPRLTLRDAACPGTALWVGIAAASGCVAVDPDPPTEIREHPACDDPTEGPAFVAQPGPFEAHRPTAELPPGLDPRARDQILEMTAGLVLADLDDDGALDLLLPQGDGDHALYWGAGDGTFADVVRPHPGGRAASGGSVADVDGDGDLDVLLYGVGALTLLVNEGGRAFSDQTSAWGLAPSGPGWPGGSAWSDVDGDGDLDLFVGGYAELIEPPGNLVPSPDALWLNDGDSFRLANELLSPLSPGLTLHPVFADLDGDGDQALVRLADFGDFTEPTSLYENTGGAFVDRRPETLATGFAMGGAVEDLDGDGLVDLFVSNLGRPTAWRGLGAWDWVDVSASWAAELPTAQSDVSWSMVPLDADADGVDELWVTYGPLDPSSADGPGYDPAQPDRLLRRVGDTWEVTLSPAGEAAPTSSRGLVVGDLDGDGVLDAVTGVVDGQPLLARGLCTDGARLQVELRGDGPNRRGVGARVEARTDGGFWSREVRAGGPGTFSGQGPTVHFGLGDAASVDLLVVWPDGEEQQVPDVPAHAAITVRRTSG